MLPKLKGSTKNVLVIDGNHGSRRYMYQNSFEVDPDELLQTGIKSVKKMAIKGYDQMAGWAHDMYRTYKMKRLLKKAKKGVAQLRAVIHL